MRIEALQEEIKHAMPALDKNLSAAHDEYMCGELNAGAYNYILARHATALEWQDYNPKSVEDALTGFKACAPLSIDIYTGCCELGKPEILERWKAFYVENGFTETHQFFGYPIMPEQEVKKH